MGVVLFEIAKEEKSWEGVLTKTIGLAKLVGNGYVASTCTMSKCIGAKQCQIWKSFQGRFPAPVFDVDEKKSPAMRGKLYVE